MNQVWASETTDAPEVYCDRTLDFAKAVLHVSELAKR